MKTHLGFDPSFPGPWVVETSGGAHWIKDATGTIVTSIGAKFPYGEAEEKAAKDVAERIVKAVNNDS